MSDRDFPQQNPVNAQIDRESPPLSTPLQMDAKGLKLKISDVARETGINRGTLTRLYQETAERVDLDAIDQLCRYLEVSVADILEYTPVE